MIPKKGINIEYVRAALWRRIWYVVLPFFVLSISAVVYCIKAPKVYQSSSLILVQPQEVPQEYVRSTVTSKVKARLNTITEQIMSRSKLEALIEKYDLYPKIRETGNPRRAIEKMRRSISISFKRGSASTPEGGFDSPPAFVVSFTGSNPEKVMNVTADLTDMFVSENLKIREEQAGGTSNFLETELQRMRSLLREKEELVREFREKYVGLLPEQKENNYRILEQLQQHLDSVNASLQQAEDRKVLLQTQFDRLESLQTDSMDRGVSARGTADSLTPLSVEELRQQLQAMRGRYSDRHPDVVRLAATLAKRERELKETSGEPERGRQNVLTGTTEAQRLMLVQKENLLTQVKLADKEIDKLRTEISQTSSQIEEYRHRIEEGPRVEQMFVDLRRDYQRASDNYQSLLEKKLQADLARNLERTQKGEQFKIQDRANFPQRPFKPDILKVLAFGMMLGMSSGLGLAFLREYLDPTFWSRREVENVLDLPVLISIPIIQTQKERRRQMFKLVGTVCVLAIMSSALLCALFVLWRRNPGFLPL